MARGINFKAEKSNQQMTQYVATRWYRAPELIVASHQGYGTAIDIWSVGCIFAEMLRRRPLFPGRDLLNQLAMIFGTFGVPSRQYLHSLDSETVCGFIKRVTTSSDIRQQSFSELCPTAGKDALDLLSKMIVIEPEKRITVETAISHPYLSKYHDASYEPDCAKTFDFCFEQDLVNLQTDEQKRVKIQELLRKEVVSYRKPAAMDFGTLIQQKSCGNKQNSTEKDDPYADLNAFLAQLASPTKDDSVKSHNNNESNRPISNSSNSLLAGAISDKTRTSKHGSSRQNSLLGQNIPSDSQTKANPLLTGASKANPLLVGAPKANPLLVGAPKANPLLAGSTNTNPLLAGASKPNPLLAGASKPNPLLAGVTGRGAVSNSLLVGATKPNALLAANTSLVLRPTDDRFDYQSHQDSQDAFSKAQDGQDKGVVVVSTSEDDHSNDADLFNKIVNNQMLKVDTTEKSDDVEMLSAKLEQTEISDAKASTQDIEMLSAKLDQADLLKGKTAAEELAGKALDTKLLLRQRIMQAKLNKQATGNLKVQEEKKVGKAPVTAHQRQKERKELRKQRQLKAQQKKKKNKEADAASNQLLTSEDQRMLERWRKMAKPQPIQPKPSTQTAMASVAASSTSNSNVIVVYPTLSSSSINTYVTVTQTTGVSSNQMIPGTQLTSQSMQQLPVLPQQTNLPQNVAAIESHSSVINIPASQQPIRTFADLSVMSTHIPQSQTSLDDNYDASFYDLNYANNEAAYQTVSQPPPTENITTDLQLQENIIPNWSNSVSVDTTLDLGSLMKPKSTTQNEGLPPMFVSTPKGTGAGYGVGYDMESLIPYTPEIQTSQMMDSAPLSASLLADWMDVTGNMDPQALDEIQQELSSALDDFPFSNY